MSVVVVTPPPPLVDLDLAKRHLRVDWDTDDDLIQAYIDAASSAIDGPRGELQCAIGQQTLEMRLDSFDAEDWRFGDGYAWTGGWADDAWRGWPFGRIALRCPPLIAVQSITFTDGAGADQVLTPDGWQLDGDGVDPAFGAVWPYGRVSAGAVRIRYTAGYLEGQVPRAVVAAVLLMVGDYYANREGQLIGDRAAVAANPNVANLLAPYRVWAA